MTARRLLSALLVVPEEDEEPRSRRSRRDWAADCSLFLLAVAAGGLALADQIGRDAASGNRPEGDSCTDESRATDRLRTVFKSGRAAYS